MNSRNSGFRSLPTQLTVAKSVPNLPFATSLLHRIGENIGGTLTLRKNSCSNLKNGPNNIVKVQVPPQRNTNHHHNFSNKPNSVKYRNALNRKKSASLEPMKVTLVIFELNLIIFKNLEKRKIRYDFDAQFISSKWQQKRGIMNFFNYFIVSCLCCPLDRKVHSCKYFGKFW